MKAGALEVQLSRVFQLLDELEGKPIDELAWDGYDERVYNRGVSKELLDTKTAELCKKLKALREGVSNYSLELQMWWRNHQRHDQKRVMGQKQNQQDAKLRRQALAKLTPTEKKVLGLV
jgi:hypothetical protein